MYPAGTAGTGGAYGNLPAQTAIHALGHDGSAVIELKNNSYSDYAGTLLVYRPGAKMPQDETDGAAVDAGVADTYTITGLSNHQTYTVRAFAYNQNKELQTDITGAVRQFVPQYVERLDALTLGATVMIEESGVPVPYIAIMHDYESQAKTLLLRKEIHSLSGLGKAAYMGSTVDTTMNEVIYNQFGEFIKSIVTETVIQQRPGNLTNLYEKKVFALSTTELGLGNANYAEGTVIPTIASNADLRIAKYNGTAANWWSRTINAAPVGNPPTPRFNARYISPTGSVVNMTPFDSSATYGIRPAIAIAGHYLLAPNGDGTYHFVEY